MMDTFEQVKRGIDEIIGTPENFAGKSASLSEKLRDLTKSLYDFGKLMRPMKFKWTNSHHEVER